MALPVDVSGRALELRPIDWTRLFAPKRVVVIGATDTEGTQQRAQFTQNARPARRARGADVVPVHPTKPDILGTPAYRTISDVPGDVDVAVVLVRDALPAVEECLAKGVAFTVVFSAGFGEVGTEEGAAAEARLAELARGPMRVIGPNTNLNIFEPWPEGFPGKKLVIITALNQVRESESRLQEVCMRNAVIVIEAQAEQYSGIAKRNTILRISSFLLDIRVTVKEERRSPTR